MSFNRRSFIRSNALIAGALLLSDTADALASVTRKINTAGAALEGVNIFHSNDMNGQVSRGVNGYGGLDLFRKNVQDHEIRGLLLDAGGFLNASESKQQHQDFIALMNSTGYHAATPGIAELSRGQEYLAGLCGRMAFTMVNCNYQFSDPVLNEKIKPYLVLKYGRQKVGVTGVGPKINTAGIGFRDPSESLARVSAMLKDKENCDLVICLAHLGFEPSGISTLDLAEGSENIDFIIGGDVSARKIHGTSVVKNKAGYDVFVSHSSAKASVFNHTHFALANTVHVKSAVPGLASGKLAAMELAKIDSFYQPEIQLV